jgi:hypothetical protein
MSNAVTARITRQSNNENENNVRYHRFIPESIPHENRTNSLPGQRFDGDHKLRSPHERSRIMSQIKIRMHLRILCESGRSVLKDCATRARG